MISCPLPRVPTPRSHLAAQQRCAFHIHQHPSSCAQQHTRVGSTTSVVPPPPSAFVQSRSPSSSHPLTFPLAATNHILFHHTAHPPTSPQQRPTAPPSSTAPTPAVLSYFIPLTSTPSTTIPICRYSPTWLYPPSPFLHHKLYRYRFTPPLSQTYQALHTTAPLIFPPPTAPLTTFFIPAAAFTASHRSVVMWRSVVPPDHTHPPAVAFARRSPTQPVRHPPSTTRLLQILDEECSCPAASHRRRLPLHMHTPQMSPLSRNSSTNVVHPQVRQKRCSGGSYPTVPTIGTIRQASTAI